MFKSGTSLLRAMLGQHSRIATGLETQWFELPTPPLSSAGGVEHVSRIARLLGFGAEELLKLVCTADTPEALLQVVMDSFAAAHGKPRWAEKTPGNVAHMTRITAFWPDARILHVIRDPRDVYASHVAAGKTRSAHDFVRRWSQIMEAAEAQKHQLAGLGDNYLELRYEQLVHDPGKVMKTVVSFLDEPWEDQVAIFEGKPDDFRRVLEVTGKASVTLKHLADGLNDSRIGLWRSVVGKEGFAELVAVADQAACRALFRRLIEQTPGVG
jgi:hypothetical protein